MATTTPPGPSPQEHTPSYWSARYRNGTHGWDRRGPSLALADLLSHRPDLVPPPTSSSHRRLTALVPGCGRGHDVLLLKTYGYDVVGLDWSQDGIRLAQENANTTTETTSSPLSLLLPPPPAPVQPGRESWLVADFFSTEWTAGLGTDGDGKFDLIFDYTFLCALPLALRPRWARRVSDLLAPAPTSRLVCLEYPSGKPHTRGGPPWGVHPEVYEALLARPGEELPGPYRDDGTIPPHIDAKPAPGALHRLGLVKPVRTHAAGTDEDGSVQDFISVWSR